VLDGWRERPFLAGLKPRTFEKVARYRATAAA